MRKDDVLAWAARLANGRSLDTQRGTRLVFKRIFQIAEESALILQNPSNWLTAIKPVKTLATKPKHELTPAQFAIILATMAKGRGPSRRAGELAALLLYSGARLSEMVGNKTKGSAGVRWCDVDFEANRLTLDTAKRRKNSRERVTRIVPLNGPLRALLEGLRTRYNSDGPTDRVSKVAECQNTMRSACRKLGGEYANLKLTHHDLRHLNATWQVQAGIDFAAVAGILGHLDGGMLLARTYSHLQQSHLQASAVKLSAFLTPAPPAPQPAASPIQPTVPPLAKDPPASLPPPAGSSSNPKLPAD